MKTELHILRFYPLYTYLFYRRESLMRMIDHFPITWTDHSPPILYHSSQITSRWPCKLWQHSHLFGYIGWKDNKQRGSIRNYWAEDKHWYSPCKMSESYRPDNDAFPESPYDIAFLVCYALLIGSIWALLLNYPLVTKRSGLRHTNQLCYGSWCFFDGRMFLISQVWGWWCDYLHFQFIGQWIPETGSRFILGWSKAIMEFLPCCCANFELGCCLYTISNIDAFIHHSQFNFSPANFGFDS